MATLSYIIPIGDMSLSERKLQRDNAIEAVRKAAFDKAVVTTEGELLIRNIQPFTDLALAPVANNEEWRMAGPGVNGTDLQYFSAALANDRAMVFYGLGLNAAPAIISRVRLTLGAASAQTRGSYQIEELETRWESAGYFSEVVVYKPTETVRVMVMPKVAFGANAGTLVLFGRTAEPVGGVVSIVST